MPKPDREQIGQLTEEIVRLLKRVEKIEDRLARLESQEPNSVSPEPATFPPNPPPLPPPTLASTPPAATDRPGLETRMGLTWVNRIGAITLMIGVGFFFKYAIDNQWIGETGRVILGVLAGLAALAAGEVLWRWDQKIFAQGICGLGVSILYLSFYAGFGFYHLLPQAAAFALMAMVTAICGALALRYDAMAVAALGMLGGYATPMLLSTGRDAPWTFFSYVFLIGLGTLAIARPRRWRQLELMAFLATVILYASWFVQWFKPEKQIVATAAALAFYGLFAVVEWAWIFYAIQVLAGIALAAIWPEVARYLVLSLVVGAAGLAIADRTRRPLAAWFSFATFWGAYGVWSSANGAPHETLIVFLLLTITFAMYLAWTPVQIMMRRAEARTPDLIVLALNGPIYFAYSYFLLEPHYHAWMGLFAAGVAAVYLLVAMQLQKERAAGRDSRTVLLTLGIALALITVAVPIQFTGFTITISWALEAAALLWIGGRTNENRVLLAALAVYVLIFCRLYTFDAWAVEAHHAALANLRFFTFAISAISFWLGSSILKTRLKTLQKPAAVGYITGHFIMLSGCLFELNDWVSTAVSLQNEGSVLAIGASILMALYAVLLISIGVAYRSTLDRILGLGLLGLVVLKLYLYDVWEASRLFRTGAFVALGILLLLTSYLYSRFRPVIETWWKNPEP